MSPNWFFNHCGPPGHAGTGFGDTNLVTLILVTNKDNFLLENHCCGDIDLVTIRMHREAVTKSELAGIWLRAPRPRRGGSAGLLLPACRPAQPRRFRGYRTAAAVGL